LRPSLIAATASPRHEQGRLFERFFRSTATAHVPGTGLGLAIVRAIVESHGGSIAFTSDEGRGTTFTVSLPLAASNTAGNAHRAMTSLLRTRPSPM
jgi:signal transduction histidine kinase